jgi:hypothetical protein
VVYIIGVWQAARPAPAGSRESRKGNKMTPRINIIRSGNAINLCNDDGVVVGTLFDGSPEVIVDNMADTGSMLAGIDYAQVFVELGLTPDTIRTIDSMPAPAPQCCTG